MADVEKCQMDQDMKVVFPCILYLILTIGLFVSEASFAEVMQGRVVGVYDGDTLTVLSGGNQQVKVRLAEIDAPELKQPYGASAKQALSNLVFSKTVTVRFTSLDRYKRVRGRVYFEEQDVNLTMVRLGHAWAYDQYLSDMSVKDAETQARNAKLGLWKLQKDQIIPPWNWRHSRTSKTNTKPTSIQKRQDEKFKCSGKSYCRDMSSCAEAKYYLRYCGLSRLDGNSDGTPCEALCN